MTVVKYERPENDDVIFLDDETFLPIPKHFTRALLKNEPPIK
jgi:hypothetical protein